MSKYIVEPGRLAFLFPLGLVAVAFVLLGSITESHAGVGVYFLLGFFVLFFSLLAWLISPDLGTGRLANEKWIQKDRVFKVLQIHPISGTAANNSGFVAQIQDEKGDVAWVKFSNEPPQVFVVRETGSSSERTYETHPLPQSLKTSA